MLPFLELTFSGSRLIISSYNLLMGIGIVSGLLVLQKTCKKIRIPNAQADNLWVMVAASLLTGLISAVLLNKVYHYENSRNFLSELTKYTGMTFEGGLVGGAITFVLIYKSLNKGFKGILKLLNCITPSIVIGHFFGRVGCFLAGCCFGKPTSSPIGIVFPARSLAAQYYGEGVKVVPVQLMEAVFLAILFLLISNLLLNYSFSTYLISYGIFRFFIEYFRGDDRGILFQTVFSPSQCMSLIMVIIGATVLLKEASCAYGTAD